MPEEATTDDETEPDEESEPREEKTADSSDVTAAELPDDLFFEDFEFEEEEAFADEKM